MLCAAAVLPSAASERSEAAKRAEADAKEQGSVTAKKQNAAGSRARSEVDIFHSKDCKSYPSAKRAEADARQQSFMHNLQQ